MVNWKVKAVVMKICDLLPFSGAIYKSIQKTVGRLDACPMSRIPLQIEIVKWLEQFGRRVSGMRVLEVGTGHLPIVPIGLFICGALEIITVDMNRRLDWQLTAKALQWIASNKELMYSVYGGGIVSKQELDERLELIESQKYQPENFCKLANITYLAPADAAKLDLSDESIDLHLSVTVLEHIPRDILFGIMSEAKRLLTKDGVALHIIDLSDHFEHADKSISKVNFLRFSDRQWKIIAGNQFAYCNRLRASDYLSIFRSQNWNIEKIKSEIDPGSFEAISSGWEINPLFAEYKPSDLCTTTMLVLLSK
jgi:hypothetical protein